MKKAIITSLDENKKVAASEYGVEIHLASDEVIELEVTQYTYDDVFQYVKEYAEAKEIDDAVSKILIEFKR
ncbi:hypothetical protein R0K17_09570 [Planococcus sp. SIMBA_143]